MLTASFITFTNSIGIGTLSLFLAIALGQLISTRRDKRYEIAAGERNEWRERSERQTGEIHDLETRHASEIHDLALKVKDLEGEIKRLESLPNVERLYHLIEQSDERAQTANTALVENLARMSETSQQTLLALTELVGQSRQT